MTGEYDQAGRRAARLVAQLRNQSEGLDRREAEIVGQIRSLQVALDDLRGQRKRLGEDIALLDRVLRGSDGEGEPGPPDPEWPVDGAGSGANDQKNARRRPPPGPRGELLARFGDDEAAQLKVKRNLVSQVRLLVILAGPLGATAHEASHILSRVGLPCDHNSLRRTMNKEVERKHFKKPDEIYFDATAAMTH